MTSSGVSLRPYPVWIAYAASKRAVNALAAGLAIEEPDVACLSVTPGIAETNIQKKMREERKGTCVDW